MGRIVIVAYRPKSGQQRALRELVDAHVGILREEGLATDRPPVIMQAKDGSVVEVFEWVSPEAIEQAHENAAVQQLWRDFALVCDFLPLNQLPESAQVFAEFDSI